MKTINWLINVLKRANLLNNAMIFRYSLKIALSGLRTNKSRSALTILGIVIGITSIMVIMSLGRGAQDLILGQIEGIGARTIAISPGRHPKGMMDIMSTFTDSLKQNDLKLLSSKANLPHMEKNMPIVFGAEKIVFESDAVEPTIFGATNLFSEIYDTNIVKGRNMTDEDIKNYADVIIIGDKIKDDLFNNQEAVNQKVKVKNRSFRVIGVMEKKGQSALVNFDSAAIVPYTTAQQYIFGTKYYNRIIIQADAENNVGKTVEDIKLTLRNSHNIDDPEKDDFFVETQADAMKIVGTITSALTLFLAAVAAISLVVGGVGIMNIMLVSVTERTREIGLRKALGATGKNIMLQFLLEAIGLTLAGGVIGISLGAALSMLAAFIINRFYGLGWGYAFPLTAALLGLGVAALIGLIFGLYPARQAAKKSPMEALRYE